MGAIAEFERHASHERTVAGMATARAQGKKIGRPASIDTEAWSAIKELLADGAAIPTLAAIRGVSPQAIYYRLAQELPQGTYQVFKRDLEARMDRAATIARLGIFQPALDYREQRDRQVARRSAA